MVIQSIIAERLTPPTLNGQIPSDFKFRSDVCVLCCSSNEYQNNGCSSVPTASVSI